VVMAYFTHKRYRGVRSKYFTALSVWSRQRQGFALEFQCGGPMGKLILLTFALSTLLLGCNPKMNPTDGYAAQTQSFNAGHELVALGDGYYSYQFVDGDCTTGRHTFEQHSDLCTALFNDSLNNYCAWQQRHDDYNSECQ
jgi:hypothetical protein